MMTGHSYIAQQEPEFVTNMRQEVLGSCIEANRRSGLWAVVYGLAPYRDGDKWCVLLGENAQEGVCGFGDSPEEAIESFEVQMAAREEPS